MHGHLARLVAASAVAVAALAGSARAMPLDYELQMEMSFLGMTIGHVELTAAHGEASLAQRLSVETLGFVRELTGFRSEATSVSRAEGDARRAVAFDTRTESKRADREVVVRWDDAGNVVELATFKRGRAEASEVPAELRRDTLDPLAALSAIREWLATARAEVPTATTLAVFDGRRRYDLDVALVDRRDARFASGPTPILEVEVVMQPVAGFNDDDGDTRRVTVLVSDDEALLPLILRTGATGGLQASLYTTKACTGAGAPVCRTFSY